MTVGAFQMPTVKNWDTFLMMHKYLPCSTMAFSHLKTIENAILKQRIVRVRKSEQKCQGNKQNIEQ